MPKRFIELDNRVVSVEFIPDTPGIARRTCRCEVVSGPGWTEEEAAEILKRVVADCVSQGIDIIGWGAEP